MTSDEKMQIEINREIENWRQDPSEKALEVVIDDTKIVLNKVVENVA